MVELPPLGRMDVQLPQVSRGYPLHVAGLVVDGRAALDRLGQQDHFTLLPDLAVAVGDDMRGIGEHAQQASHPHQHAGFFPRLADGTLAGVSPSSILPIGRAHCPVSRWSAIRTGR
jgi:hypothetical protein